MCWCRPRSSIGLQLGERAREVHSATKLTQPGVGPGRGYELQPGADRLRDARTTGLLRLNEKFSRDLNSDLLSRFHSAPSIPYSAPASNMVLAVRRAANGKLDPDCLWLWCKQKRPHILRPFQNLLSTPSRSFSL